MLGITLKYAHHQNAYATTANSLDMNQTGVRIHARPTPSNATIARVLGTSRQTARLCALAAPALEVDAAILVANRVI
ncbi:MAG: hypothetical protein ALECFALPRED_002167 [Alectoria fallacina]|uniref:Uncharacterized protein n=1 Tax=Alectoria fallacina TaxID=1903189 RepID=A0A8H3ENS3_9LECA|nr:MAG: hypothetical protein ALECFALPRED_002167 [Alectoria fallacina]